MTNTILVVDDEKDIVDSLERQFRKEYKVLKATTGIEALRLLQNEKVKVIISDQRMPEMTGVQLFERAQKIQPGAIRMLLTGYTDVASVISAVNTGQIYRYITKPWDPSDLDITVKKAIETYDLRSELFDKNQKLQLALTELKTLDEAKSHFMLLIGHELKTPLTTISSFTDLLREEKLGGDSEKYLLRITQGVNRLQEIVFDVLDVLSAETDTLSIKKKSHRLSEVIDSGISELEAVAMKRELTILSDLKKEIGYFDAGLVSKVFKKILHNALKFATTGSEIVVGVENQKDSLFIFVENKGPGIPQERIDQIQKPFTLDEDIMHHSQGLGLGLSVCQSLLKRHGSLLTIDSSKVHTRVGFTISKD